MSIIRTAFLTLLVIAFTLFIRLLSVLPQFRPRTPSPRRRGSPTQLLVVLGSGGHTAEMFFLLRGLDTASYTFRRYVVSSGDAFSAQKASEFEKQLEIDAVQSGKVYGHFEIKTVTRARKIHQSLLTTPASSLKCIWDCICLLHDKPKIGGQKEAFPTPYPDAIMTNGPATATIMIFAALLIRFIGAQNASQKMRCVYIESWARVKTPSLSGKILSKAGVCDRLLVQWPRLANRGFEYKGQLIA